MYFAWKSVQILHLIVCMCYRYTTEIPDLLLCVMPRQPWGSIWGSYFGCSLTTHTKTNAKPMSSQSSCTIQHFMCVLSSSSDRCRFNDICTWWTALIWLWEKPEDPLIESHAGIKMAQVLRSLVYICGLCRLKCRSTYLMAANQGTLCTNFLSLTYSGNLTLHNWKLVTLHGCNRFNQYWRLVF